MTQELVSFDDDTILTPIKQSEPDSVEIVPPIDDKKNDDDEIIPTLKDTLKLFKTLKVGEHNIGATGPAGPPGPIGNPGYIYDDLVTKTTDKVGNKITIMTPAPYMYTPYTYSPSNDTTITIGDPKQDISFFNSYKPYTSYAMEPYNFTPFYNNYITQPTTHLIYGSEASSYASESAESPESPTLMEEVD
jgi:hypothetical protein